MTPMGSVVRISKPLDHSTKAGEAAIEGEESSLLPGPYLGECIEGRPHKPHFFSFSIQANMRFFNMFKNVLA
jgi:hypothetical protein